MVSRSSVSEGKCERSSCMPHFREQSCHDSTYSECGFSKNTKTFFLQLDDYEKGQAASRICNFYKVTFCCNAA